MDSLIESVLLVIFLVATTAIATDTIRIPRIILVNRQLSTIILMLVAIVSFGIYPALGLAILLFTIVIVFKSNILKVLTTKNMYGEESIRTLAPTNALPHSSSRSGPRSYNEFRETDPLNPVNGPLHEPFEPASYGDEQGAPIDGQYPKELDRPQADSDTEEYTYYPDADTGSNEFKRFGPNLDEKTEAFLYE